jgi:hypothetical protein
MQCNVSGHTVKMNKAYSICFRCGLMFDDKNISDIHKDITKHSISLTR